MSPIILKTASTAAAITSFQRALTPQHQDDQFYMEIEKGHGIPRILAAD
jgi:hypothetical protein